MHVISICQHIRNIRVSEEINLMTIPTPETKLAGAIKEQKPTSMVSHSFPLQVGVAWETFGKTVHATSSVWTRDPSGPEGVAIVDREFNK